VTKPRRTALQKSRANVPPASRPMSPQTIIQTPLGGCRPHDWC